MDDRYHGTINTIARSAGVQLSFVGSLVEVVTIAALAVVGGLVAEHHWSAQALSDWLRPSHGPVAALPMPLIAAAAIVVPPASQAAPASPLPKNTAAWLTRHSNTLLATMSLIAAAEFGYIMGTRLGSTEAAYAATGEVSPAAASPNASQYAAMLMANNTPPSATQARTVLPIVLKREAGQQQITGANSTESKLYQFLIDPDKEVDFVDPTKGWIGFDRIYFETNKATLTNESLWQLSNIASILKRFSDAKIKIGGYTDVSGNPEGNLQLSKERAQATMSSLISLGVSTDHLTAVGYGALDNIASNDTEEGRALNRRVSMQVVQK